MRKKHYCFMALVVVVSIGIVSCASSNKIKISGDKITGKTIGINISNSIKYHLEPNNLKNNDAIIKDIPKSILNEMGKSFKRISKENNAITIENGSISIIGKNDSVKIENVQNTDYLLYLTNVKVSRILVNESSPSPIIGGAGLVVLAATTAMAVSQAGHGVYMQELEIKGKYFLIDINSNKVIKKGNISEKDKRGYANENEQIPWNLIGLQIVATVFEDTPFISNP